MHVLSSTRYPPATPRPQYPRARHSRLTGRCDPRFIPLFNSEKAIRAPHSHVVPHANRTPQHAARVARKRAHCQLPTPPAPQERDRQCDRDARQFRRYCIEYIPYPAANTFPPHPVEPKNGSTTPAVRLRGPPEFVALVKHPAASTAFHATKANELARHVSSAWPDRAAAHIAPRQQAPRRARVEGTSYNTPVRVRLKGFPGYRGWSYAKAGGRPPPSGVTRDASPA